MNTYKQIKLAQKKMNQPNFCCILTRFPLDYQSLSNTMPSMVELLSSETMSILLPDKTIQGWMFQILISGEIYVFFLMVLVFYEFILREDRKLVEKKLTI